MNLLIVLILIAGALSILALIKPAWPLTPVAVLLICIALLVKFWDKA